MTVLSTGLIRKFDVGPVRVALWLSQDDQQKVFFTVERGYPGLHGMLKYRPLLEASDTSKAMLGLKRAHDYLARRNNVTLTEAQGAPNIAWPERLP